MAEGKKENVPDPTPNDMNQHLTENDVKERLANNALMDILLKDATCMNWISYELIEEHLPKDELLGKSLLEQMKDELCGLFKIKQEEVLFQVKIPELQVVAFEEGPTETNLLFQIQDFKPNETKGEFIQEKTETKGQNEANNEPDGTEAGYKVEDETIKPIQDKKDLTKDQGEIQEPKDIKEDIKVQAEFQEIKGQEQLEAEATEKKGPVQAKPEQKQKKGSTKVKEQQKPAKGSNKKTTKTKGSIKIKKDAKDIEDLVSWDSKADKY